MPLLPEPSPVFQRLDQVGQNDGVQIEDLDAAIARLPEALADPAEPYTIDDYELVIDLPARLVVRHERIAALGGTTDWQAPADGGTRLIVDLPVEAPC